MNQDGLLILLQQEVKGLSKYLDPADYRNAIDDACRETGWTLPTSVDFKILWIKNRAKRYLFYYLWTESASKFKVEQINLQHKFEHYGAIIKQADMDFKEVMEAYPQEFASAEDYEMFGTKVDAGFAYDPLTGADETYLPRNKVIISPEKP